MTTNNTTSNKFFAGELDATYGYTCDTKNCDTLATSVIWNACPEPEQFACSTCETQIIEAQTLTDTTKETLTDTTKGVEEIYLCPYCWNKDAKKCFICEGTGSIF